ncbi:MAG: DUF1573 domain-containing protein [Gemmataceae bacterium]
MDFIEDPLANPGVFGSPPLVIASAELETLFAIWLLTGGAERILWLASLILFGAFAALNAYLASAGVTSCGCFGQTPVSPRIMLVLDISAFCLVVWARPAAFSSTNRSVGVRDAALTAAGVLILTGIMAVAMFVVFGDIDKALAYLRGEVITLSPPFLDAGEGGAGEWRDMGISIANHRQKQIRILGGTSSCACIATEDLPVDLAPGEQRSVTVRVRFKGRPGTFTHRFALYSDDPDNAVIVARFGGRVVQKD